ncbi:hypothetical protein [Sphingomonas xinjiangensis]|uniref:Uncharacterized protein n=1 Tax=Sphingomonas xinjiangensis TaxID=643568 RepID=A0A840YNE4_9SPHN|nr:hypothetical protein [Sphingomonas xinjiangensis]MBB5709331.1 hypothetical protein [Sphingomonas xinjiangensis]
MPDERLSAIFAKIDEADAKKKAAEERIAEELRVQAENAASAAVDWVSSSAALDSAIEALNSDLEKRGMYFERGSSEARTTPALDDFVTYIENPGREIRTGVLRINVTKYGHISLQIGSPRKMPDRTEVFPVLLTRRNGAIFC